MARGGGMRRSRCDENASVKAEEEGAKRAKADGHSSVEQPKEKESRKSSKRGRRKKGRGGMQQSQGCSSVLHPLNINSTGLALEEQNVAGERKEDKQTMLIDNAEDSSPSSCARSPETAAADRTVIWSNAAFCSEQAPGGKSPDIKPAEEPKGTVAVANEVSQLSTREEENVTEKRRSIVRFEEEPEKQVREEKVAGEEEDVKQLEEEIEKEIQILTKRLAELRAKREAKHKLQERAKRALSCPPTPMTPKPEGTTAEGEKSEKSKSRRGRIVSAKFLQWHNKSPVETEPKTLEKQSRLRKPEFTLTPVQGRGVPLTPGTEVRESVQKSCQKTETASKGPVRNKVIEKLQAAAPGFPRTRGSLDGGFIDQMRNLSLSPASNASSDAYKKLDWTRSLRQNTVEKKTLPGESGDTTVKQVSVKGTAEAQLLVDIKETKASKVSPAVTRKVRAVPSRYNNGESPTVQLSSRKRSLDGSQATTESGGIATHKKRASLGQPADVYSPGASHVRKSGIGLPKPGGLNRWKSNLSVQAKEPAPTVPAINKDVLKTPVASGRKDRDGGLLESERKKLPGLMIHKNFSDSPRDSGCVKRVSQQILEKKEPYFRL